MKNIILLVLIFFSCLSVSQAQREIPQRIFLQDDDKLFYGGFSLGANISEVIGDAYHGFHKVGWHFGPGVTAKIGTFGGSLELLYSQKGSVGVKQIYSGAVGDYFERYYLKLNYVEVPVQLLVFPNPRMYFGAGLSYSRLIKVNESAQTEYPVYFNPNDFPFKKEDWCYLVSGKYQFWRGWFIGARYARSFTPIRTADKVPYYFGNGHQYNMYFTFTLSYLVP